MNTEPAQFFCEVNTALAQGLLLASQCRLGEQPRPVCVGSFSDERLLSPVDASFFESTFRPRSARVAWWLLDVTS